MIRVQIEVTGRRRAIERVAVIDTGFTSGLLLPKSVARSAGATLVRPVRLPRMLDGKTVQGFSTILAVRLVEADIEAETLVFCPDATPSETLVGSFFLSQVGARLIIGPMEYDFAMENPASLDPYDLGDVVVPWDRPSGKWW